MSTNLSKTKLFTFLSLISIVFITGCGKIGSAKKALKARTSVERKKTVKAPSFKLSDETGTIHTLADYAGKKLVLFFYPKDESPTCTAQACSIRDDFKMYEDHGIVILGISADSVKSHKKFKEHHHLPFPLLSDENGKVAKKYGAKGSVLGFFGYAQRKTYLINEQGELVKVIDDVNVANQGQDILAGFAATIKE